MGHELESRLDLRLGLPPSFQFATDVVDANPAHPLKTLGRVLTHLIDELI